MHIIITGAGLSGTILGVILQRQGWSVTILDKTSHPRFAIGESTVPQASGMLRIVALKHNIPELLNIASYTHLAGVMRTSGVKRNFGFVYHRPGERAHPSLALQSVIPDLPHGPECHWFRQDVDQYLYHVARRAGVKVVTNVDIKNVVVDDAGVQIETTRAGTFEGVYLVDCSGFSSPVARHLSLRNASPRTETSSRAIFNHCLDVRPFDQVLPSPFPRLWCQGTTHHLFDGGWLWIIPFNNTRLSNNPLCSVGLVLDNHRYPPSGATPDEEFWHRVNCLPSVAKQLEGMIPVRAWSATDRLQYTSRQTVGDRFCLMSAAATFVDPLFSRGIVSTMELIDIVATGLNKARRTGDFSAQAFNEIATYHEGALRQNDSLVRLSYRSLTDHHRWNAMFRLWLLGATLGGIRLTRHLSLFDQTGDMSHLNVWGPEVRYHGALSADLDAYQSVFKQAHDLIVNPQSDSVSIFQQCLRLFDEAALLPKLFGLSDPTMQCPTPYNIRTFVELVRWGKKGAPSPIRERYFDYGPRSFLKAWWRQKGMSRTHALRAPQAATSCVP